MPGSDAACACARRRSATATPPPRERRLCSRCERARFDLEMKGGCPCECVESTASSVRTTHRQNGPVRDADEEAVACCHKRTISGLEDSTCSFTTTTSCFESWPQTREPGRPRTTRRSWGISTSRARCVDCLPSSSGTSGPQICLRVKSPRLL
eukprot:1920577-Rhodomonas_salina.1